MCMRKCFLTHGEKVFNVLVILGFLAGAASGIMSGMEIGGRPGLIAGALQVLLSWSGTLIISLVVYALLNISCCMSKHCDKECDTDKSGCNTKTTDCH